MDQNGSVKHTTISTDETTASIRPSASTKAASPSEQDKAANNMMDKEEIG